MTAAVICALCQKPIELSTPTVSIVGGMFPREEPDFFMADEQVMQESYAHLPCLLEAVAKGQQ